jgi:hypothetical protein
VFLRLARIGRIYKVIKLFRLMRLLMLSSRPSVNMSQVVSILKVDIIYGRLYLGALYLLLFLHTSGCFLILIGKQTHLYGLPSYCIEYTSGVNDDFDMYI